MGKSRELSKEVEMLMRTQGGISEKDVEELMDEMKTKLSTLEAEYSEHMAKKEAELELANSKVHTLMVRVEALAKGAEAASSAYSGEGTDSHPNMGLMDRLKADMNKLFQKPGASERSDQAKGKPKSPEPRKQHLSWRNCKHSLRS